MLGRAFDRRQLLLGGLSAGGLALLSPRSAAARLWMSPALGAAPRTLVLLQLSGGNDGINTVVPFAEDAYHRARPNLRIHKEQLHLLDEYRGLHPGLAFLAGLFRDGKLAIVEGCGYARPDRSHFQSLAIWHAADRKGSLEPRGWIGRLVEAAYPEEKNPNLVVHLGTSAPYSLHSMRHPPAVFGSPTGYRWAGGSKDMEAFDQAGAPGRGMDKEPEDNLDFLRKVLADGQASSAAIRKASARYKTPVEYPREALASAFYDIAALVNGDLGTRVFSVELGSFDTHSEQLQRHATLLQGLDASLAAFHADLQRTEAGRNVVVLAFSEFGRRVAENGSRGTDHGAAGPMLVLGHPVKGGLYGKHPSFEQLDDGDLAYTTDFRRVYAGLIQGWFGLDPAKVLGPDHEPLKLV